MSKPIAEAKFYAMTAEAAVKNLQSDAGRGLSGSEAKKRLSIYGENRLQKGKKTSFAKKFMLQFGDFMVLILLIASAVSFAVSCMQGEANLADPLLILGIVIANAFVGTVQEAKAERALEALRTLSAPHADVLRDGKRAVISAEALVPGDVVYIRAGDVVPADLRLLESMHLQAEESALTGESVPSGKSANAVCDETCGAAERKNMLFSGTGISAGQGVGIVTATGMQTEMGRIAAMLGDEETPDTPLKLRLRRTGKLIGLLVLGICTVIFLIGLIQKAEPLEMFMISISLAVAAIPEGPPTARDSSAFSNGLGFAMAAEGMMIGALALLAFTVGRVFFDADPMQPAVGRTMAFAVLSLSQLVHSYNMRSTGPVLGRGMFKNRGLNVSFLICSAWMAGVVVFPQAAALFGSVPLTLTQWGIVAILALLPLPICEMQKRILSRTAKVKNMTSGVKKRVIFNK